MPRVRTRPINPYIQQLMDERGITKLKDLAIATGIPYETLRGWADIDGEHQFFASILNAARLLNKSPEDLMRGLMGQAS